MDIHGFVEMSVRGYHKVIRIKNTSVLFMSPVTKQNYTQQSVLTKNRDPNIHCSSHLGNM